jgi:hypothetical protein
MSNSRYSRRRFVTNLSLAATAATVASGRSLPAADSSPLPAFVRVSPRDPRYFELSDGRPYIPVGFNLVGAPAVNDMQRVVTTMADHGVNYCRIWLDQAPWNVEHAQSGQYDAEKARSLDAFLALCRPHGIRVKMCIEWFRSIMAETPRPPVNGLNPKLLHHTANGGFYRDMPDYLNSEQGRNQFKDKLKWYAARYGNEPTIFAWELWNEMNAVRGPWYPWTQEMLPELHRRFPKNLCVQSLGSFDRDGARAQYRLLCELPGNDVLQVHRYLDPGAALDICHGPIDLLAADAVGELRAMGIRKPIILAETGAVKPRHTGASPLYAKDTDGTLLHDMLFTPFFAGAAGSGHVWFWREAIDRPNHWHHFRRFQRAVEGIDPPAEGFETLRADLPGLRIHALRGRRTLLAWCRDTQSDWQNELESGAAPREIKGTALDLSAFQLSAPLGQATVTAYDPWSDRSTPLALRGATVVLPDFRRSLVVRVIR